MDGCPSTRRRASSRTSDVFPVPGSPVMMALFCFRFTSVRRTAWICSSMPMKASWGGVPSVSIRPKGFSSSRTWARWGVARHPTLERGLAARRAPPAGAGFRVATASFRASSVTPRWAAYSIPLGL